MDFWPGYLPLGNFRIGSLLELEDSLQEESGVCRIVVILSSCTPTAIPQDSQVLDDVSRVLRDVDRELWSQVWFRFSPASEKCVSGTLRCTIGLNFGQCFRFSLP